MRELNECTAEVFRRGEKRIKERRRTRNRVLAVCIPVCLIAAVWSVKNLPAIRPAGATADSAPALGEINGNAQWSQSCPYVSVEIQGAGTFPEEQNGQVTDSAAVADMFNAIQSLFADVDGNDQDSNGNLSAGEILTAADPTAFYDQDGQVESASAWKGRTITFTAGDGSQAVYRLSENMLVNADTGETVWLSEAQAAELLAVFDISE